MKPHIRFPLLPCTDVAVLAPRDDSDFGSLSFHHRAEGCFTDFALCFGPGSVKSLALLHRALGACLDTYCPGLVSALPNYALEEQEEASAMREQVDREWTRINTEED